MDNQPNSNPPNQEPNQTFSPQPAVPPASTPTTDAAPTTGEQTPQQQPSVKPIAVGAEKSQKSKTWLLVLLLVLAMAAVGGFLLTRHKNTATPAVNTLVKHDVPLIRYATADGPINVFYPSKEMATISGVRIVNSQIFEGLVGWQGGTKIVPLLAKSWTNPDDSTWIFTLRPNVKFHTGRVLTSADVKYSLDNFKDNTYDDQFGTTIKTVTVVSPTQVKVTTDGPDPLLLNRLTNLYVVDSKGTKINDSINGTGPYILKTGTDPTKDAVTDLVAFDGYWGGHVYTRELQFSQIIHEADQVTALKNHKIDVLDLVLDKTKITELKTANISVLPQQSLVVDQVIFNTLKAGSPLGNLKFRQALNVGVDRTAIIKAAGVDGTPIGQYMVSVVPGYVPKLTAPTQDVTKAKSLIAESGVKNPTLTISYGTDSSNLALLTEFQKECAALGVTIKLDPINDINVLIAKFSDGKTDMFFAANSSALFDGSDVLSSFQFPGVYNNAKVNDLLDKANQTIDGAKHLDLLQQAAEALNDDVGGLPLYTRNAFYAQNGTAYKIPVEIPGVNTGAYFWKVYQ